MAGFGAPLVWHINKAAFPSVTIWSDEGNVNVGAIPETWGESIRRTKTDRRLLRGEKVKHKEKTEEWKKIE